MAIYEPQLKPPSRSASALNGKIVLPGHRRFEEARRAWNLGVDQHPAAVVFPESAEDVVAAVLFAQERGQQIAAQGTGHGAAPLGSLEDAILVKTERMREVTIDPERRIARVEAGVLWAEVVEAAAAHGLAGLQGSSPDVGVVGYTLGGGLSFMGRKHGLATNRVHAIELVAADGRPCRVDRESDPELFWALRGGGGSFGVVTALEFELFPAREIYAGILWYPVERAGEVLHAWRELTQNDPPDELTTVGRILNLPPIEEIPEPVRGKSFAVVEAYHLADPRQADELLAPLRALGPINDTIASISMPALSHVHMDPEHPVPGSGDGLIIAELPGAAVDALVEVAGAEASFPLLSVEVRHLGGELARARPDNGALASIPGQYVMYAVGMTPVPELVGPTEATVRAVKEAMTPWGAAHGYLNFTESRQPVETLWPADAFQRLRKIKTAVDPDDVVRSNHPIPPIR
jgi:FAD/FMN-containing dehydrogenase